MLRALGVLGGLLGDLRPVAGAVRPELVLPGTQPIEHDFQFRDLRQ